MSNKKHKNNLVKTNNIKVIDNNPKIWCEYCTEEEIICKGKCKNKK